MALAETIAARFAMWGAWKSRGWVRLACVTEIKMSRGRTRAINVGQLPRLPLQLPPISENEMNTVSSVYDKGQSISESRYAFLRYFMPCHANFCGLGLTTKDQFNHPLRRGNARIPKT